LFNTDQSIIVWTPKTKSLLPSLYKGRNLPLFGYLFPAAQAGKRGEGRFFKQYVFSINLKIALFSFSPGG
jgi:hypothetical protein